MPHIKVHFVCWMFGTSWLFVVALAMHTVANAKNELVRAFGSLAVIYTACMVAISFLICLFAIQKMWI